MSQKEVWRNSRSLPRRFNISWLATQNWLDWGEVHHNGQIGKRKQFVAHPLRSSGNIGRIGIPHWKKSGRNAPMKLRSDFREALSNMHRLHRESGVDRPGRNPFYQYQRWHSFLPVPHGGSGKNIGGVHQLKNVNYLWVHGLSSLGEEGDLFLTLPHQESDRLQLIAICSNGRCVWTEHHHTSQFLVFHSTPFVARDIGSRWLSALRHPCFVRSVCYDLSSTPLCILHSLSHVPFH